MNRIKSCHSTSLEQALCVQFVDKGLLHQALVHSSYLNENPNDFTESNSRLEFLGDAVLGIVAAEELYRSYPEWSEGKLTEARSVLVRGGTLAIVARRLQIGACIYVGKGEEDAGGRERSSTLAATFEALVGALFLDQGLEVARDFVLRSLSLEIAELNPGWTGKSPKSTLQEVVQAEGVTPPEYFIVEVDDSGHPVLFTAEVSIGGIVLGRGRGTRKSHAEQEAASDALRVRGL